MYVIILSCNDLNARQQMFNNNLNNGEDVQKDRRYDEGSRV